MQDPQELLALAKAEGYALSDEELDAISGGIEWGDIVDGIADCTALGYSPPGT